MLVNEIYLASLPNGPVSEDNFGTRSYDVPNYDEYVKEAPNRICLKAAYISVDPYMRPRMRPADEPNARASSYIPPLQVNKPVDGGVVCLVEHSSLPGFVAGDFVAGFLPWQTRTCIEVKEGAAPAFKLLPANVFGEKDGKICPSYALGVLGMPGVTAYCGYKNILTANRPHTNSELTAANKPKVCCVSGTAGAVGMIVAQLAQLDGMKVIGIAGGPEKCEFLKNTLKLDAVFDYRELMQASDGVSTDASKKLEKLLGQLPFSPQGIDYYFDNVGGWISDAVIKSMAIFGNVAVCGAISDYNAKTGEPSQGPRISGPIIFKRLRIEGLIYTQFAGNDEDTALKELAGLVMGKKLIFCENVSHGFDATIDAFLGLFQGENLGKQIVKV